MPRPGSPWDNALVESLFETLKRGLAKEGSCKTREGAKQGAFRRIELCFSRQRMRFAIGHNAARFLKEATRLPLRAQSVGIC